MTRSSSFRRRGFSAVEAAIVTLIVAAAVIPMYLLFQRTGQTGYRSSIAYKAIHVAREELEEIRLMPLFAPSGVEPYVGHEWEPVAGKPIFGRALLGEAPADGLEGEDMIYPESYLGIETMVQVVAPPVDPDTSDFESTRVVRLEVRWKLKGEAKDAAARGTQLFHVVVSRRGG